MTARHSAPLIAVALAIAGNLSGCDRPSAAIAKCSALYEGDPSGDAAHDLRNGERYLMADVLDNVGGRVYASPIPGKICHFTYSKEGVLLKTNRRTLLHLPRGVTTAPDTNCLNRYHLYERNYNTAFQTDKPDSASLTCS